MHIRLCGVLLGLLFCTPFGAFSAEGDFAWARAMGGAGFDIGNDIALDGAGNVYTTGYFEGTVDFDPGEGVYNLTSAGFYDIFVQKLNANGGFLWARAMGFVGFDKGRGIAVDNAGNVYTTGTFRYRTDFDPGAGTFKLTSAGLEDIFVQKMDTNGNFVWARALGGTDRDEGFGITVDDTGNVYTTGYFQGTVDFDPGPGTVNLTSAGEYDIFVQKLDADGDFVWARAMGGTDWDGGKNIAVDSAGNVYTMGYFQGTVDFHLGPRIFNLTSTSQNDIFVQKLDADGNFVWARAMGGSGPETGKGLAVDSSGNVYVTGYFSGTVDFDPGAGAYNLTSAGLDDIFVQKLDANGDFLWARGMGATAFDVGYGIAVDGVGNVYTTGFFAGTADFDPGPGTFNLASPGNRDLFLQKLDANGDFVWARAMRGTSELIPFGIAVDGASNVYTTGYFSGTADFDPGPGIFNLTTAGITGVFVSKLAGAADEFHSTDQNGDTIISLLELLRLFQLYNSLRFGCDADTEDGYAPGGTDESCPPYDADYEQDWVISLGELLRVLQFFNLGGYTHCPDAATEDGFCPGF